jgi:hypothetical protein
VKRLSIGILLSIALTDASARADGQLSGSEAFPGRHALSLQLGYQAGFGEKLGDPSGFKLLVEYAYRFHPLVWFDLQLNQVFGAGAQNGFCRTGSDRLCYRGGSSTEFAGGVKVKFAIREAPLIFEVPILAAVNVLYARECEDNGSAVPLLRVGAGLRYFLTSRIGIGGGFYTEVGPAFHASTPCRAGGAFTDFFGAFELVTGAEFIL